MVQLTVPRISRPPPGFAVRDTTAPKSNGEQELYVMLVGDSPLIDMLCRAFHCLTMHQRMYSPEVADSQLYLLPVALVPSALQGEHASMRLLRRLLSDNSIPGGVGEIIKGLSCSDISTIVVRQRLSPLLEWQLPTGTVNTRDSESVQPVKLVHQILKRDLAFTFSERLGVKQSQFTPKFMMVDGAQIALLALPDIEMLDIIPRFERVAPEASKLEIHYGSVQDRALLGRDPV
jgi:hypothetical protein